MKNKNTLSILIPSLIFVIAWIIFSIHHSIVTPTIFEPLTTQIIQISSNFDTNTIASLKKRQNVTPNYQLSAPVQNIVIPATGSATTPTPTPTIINQPVGTTSAETATPGGSIVE